MITCRATSKHRAAPDEGRAVKAPPLPREHGAWGILLIPFVSATTVAGIWNLPVTLLLGSVLCFYLARTSWLKGDMKWTLTLLAGSIILAVVLISVWSLWWLPVFGAAGLAGAMRKTSHGLNMQLFAVACMTLTAAAAWYAATGAIDRMAWSLWLLNTLYFTGGVFHVKMRVAAAALKRPLNTIGGRWRLGVRNLLYHTAVLVVLIALSLINWWPAGVAMAFVPAWARAVQGAATMSPTLKIRRLGWSEVAHSVVFLALLTATR